MLCAMLEAFVGEEETAALMGCGSFLTFIMITLRGLEVSTTLPVCLMVILYLPTRTLTLLLRRCQLGSIATD